jgi:hypothetical protein
MQILKMHNLTQNYRINLAARGILQSHGTLRHMTDESNNGIARTPVQIYGLKSGSLIFII